MALGLPKFSVRKGRSCAWLKKLKKSQSPYWYGDPHISLGIYSKSGSSPYRFGGHSNLGSNTYTSVTGNLNFLPKIWSKSVVHSLDPSKDTLKRRNTTVLPSITTALLDLQVGRYLLAGRILAKATNHLKSLLGTRHPIGNRNRKREGYGIKTSTNSISQNSDKSHTRSDGKTPRISPRNS